MPPIISEHTQIQPQSHPTEIRACVQQSPSPPLCLLGLKMCFCGCPTLPKTLRQGWIRPAGWRNLHRGAVLGQKRLSPDSAPSENSHFSFLTKMAKNGDLTVNDSGMESSKWYSPDRSLPQRTFDLPREMVMGCFCWYKHGQSKPSSSSSGFAELVLLKC